MKIYKTIFIALSIGKGFCTKKVNVYWKTSYDGQNFQMQKMTFYKIKYIINLTHMGFEPNISL